MNIRDIVEEYLKTNGFDGLCENNGCGCWLDNLMPCYQPDERNCKPGYSYSKEEFEKLFCINFSNNEGYDKVICVRKPDNR